MENINLKSLEEVAVEVLRSENTQLTYLELFEKVATLKGFNEEDKKREIARFYTDITSSGNFVYCGDDKWCLKESLSPDDLDSEFFEEHNEVEVDENDAYFKTKHKKGKKFTTDENGELIADVSYNDYVAEGNKDDDEDESVESYEKMGLSDEDYEEDFEDNDYSEEDDEEEDSEYERDVDDDEDYEAEDEDDEFDENEYNSIMDEWEDSYDK